MIKKFYQPKPEKQAHKRYSPSAIVGIETTRGCGNPDEDRICTSHIERLNLTLRMQMRRFTRLTNGFSKSLDHHIAMQNLFFCWYNFVRPHHTLKGQTPAMVTGLTERPVSIKEVLEISAKG